VKIIHVETLINKGSFAHSRHWKMVRKNLHEAIKEVVWPTGNDKFTIYPESGKRRQKGNGVKPIKSGLMLHLQRNGWKLEEPLDIAFRRQPGKLDAVLVTKYGPVALEWETGNISSSHRALNKLCVGLIHGKLAGGILIVPSRDFYQYLTDRVGNYEELVPYLDLWKGVSCLSGLLEIVVIKHDAVSVDVPRIPKGTSGRALQ
jgi:hypothetical protein